MPINIIVIQIKPAASKKQPTSN